MTRTTLAPLCAKLRSSRGLLVGFALIVVVLAPTVAAGDKGSGGAPSIPTKVGVVGASTTTISLSWDPVPNVEEYFLTRNGQEILKTKPTRITIDALPCGTSFLFGVATRTAASPEEQSMISASTTACDTGSAAAAVPAPTSATDTQAPTLPEMFTVERSTSTTLSVSWRASTDAVGVAGYGLYLNGSQVGTVTGTSYVFSSLACGASQRIAVDAFDAAGNRSARNDRVMSTEGCGASAAPSATTAAPSATTAAPSATTAAPSAATAAPGDVTPPTLPTWFTVERSTTSTLSVSWRPASDAVGVVGYGLYLNGDRVGTATGTDYVYRSLSCGTSQRIAVDAFDAAGNRSARNDRVISTDRCTSSSPATATATATATPTPAPDTQPPTAPTNVVRTDSTPTSVTISWGRATDNIAVAGYGLYIDGKRVSTSGGTSAFFGALACGSTVRLGVDAFDAAGNRSPRVDVTTSTASCPARPAGVVCDKVAQPGQGTAAALLASLSSGQIGCLRGGLYTASSVHVLDFTRSGVALVGYPGERAVVRGIVVVRQGVDGARLADVMVEGTGGSNTIQVYGTDFVLEDSDITNAWRGRSCLMLGDGSAGTAVRPLIRRNRFHECGSLANGNKDHAIYAAHVTDGRISENQFWNTAAYSVHLYPDAQRTVVSHNTIDGGSPSVRGGIVFGGDGNEASRDNIVEYNVIAYAATYNIESWWGAAIGTGNIARSNCVWGGGAGNISQPSGFTAVGNVVAEPRFADRSSRDYSLLSGSPCLGVIQ